MKFICPKCSFAIFAEKVNDKWAGKCVFCGFETRDASGDELSFFGEMTLEQEVWMKNHQEWEKRKIRQDLCDFLAER